MPPLVITLALPDDVQRDLDALRHRWFPPGRTAIGAHLTLFHAVPGQLADEVRADLAEQATAGPLELRFSRVISLGRGAAYAVDCPPLVERHAALQRAWWPHLTRQDQQPLRAHVTLQNEVEPATARETLTRLRQDFRPFSTAAVGLDLWRYDGGPWTHLTRVPVG